MNLVTKKKKQEKPADDKEFEDLMAFADNLPSEAENDDCDLELNLELEKLKKRIDEIYAKQNIFKETKKVMTMEDKPLVTASNEPKEAEKTEMAFTNTMYDLQKMVYVDEIEDQSQKILREVRKRKERQRKEAPFLQPFVYRMK